MYQFDLGELFWLDIAYEDSPEESKVRPVIIVGKKEKYLLILVSTTSQSPNNPPSLRGSLVETGDKTMGYRY